MACDTAASLSDVWYRLGFLSQADLNAAQWLTSGDLYQFADEAAKRLAWTCGIFKVFDSSVAIANGTGPVTLPPGHVFTAFAYIDYGAGVIQILRLTNVEQLYALDAGWTSLAGSPTRLSFDAGAPGSGGLGIATLYPSATASGSLNQVIQQTPPTVQAGASVLQVTPCIQDYFTYALLEQALAKESDHARPEVSAHATERMRLYEKVFQQYYGPGM